MMERLFPETLLRLYFNTCRGYDERPTWEGLNQFAEDIATNYKTGPHHEIVTDYYIKRRQGDEPTQK